MPRRQPLSARQLDVLQWILLSVKAASKHLGLSTAALYELIHRGEIAHVMIGSRRYISRDQTSAFIEANTHIGY